MNRKELEQSTEREEGYREGQYKDTEGLWTFGIGRCLERAPLSAEEFRFLFDNNLMRISISHEGAVWLMRRYLDEVIVELHRRLPWLKEAHAIAQGVLIEMSYQMGPDKVCGSSDGSIRGFKNMLAALQVGDLQGAARHGRDSKWWRIQTHSRAERLMKRLEKAAKSIERVTS